MAPPRPLRLSRLRDDEYLAPYRDVLESRSKGKSPLIKWFERLGRYYDRRFGGRDWREKEKDFWEKRIRALK